MSKFKIGDRVIANCNYEGRITKNKKGKVIDIKTYVYDVAVEFDEAIENCHDAAGAGKYGHCLYMKDYCLDLIPKNNNKIVITTDGTETLARLYDGNKVIKSAVAKCSPDDTFDFGTGARIAFDRLIGEKKKAEEKPSKYKTGDKVKVIANTCHHFRKIGETVTLGAPYTTIMGEKAWFIIGGIGFITENDIEPIKFNVGDRVKIINRGKRYPTYAEWFTKNAPELAVYYRFDDFSTETDGEYIIRKIAPHGSGTNITLYAIQNPATKRVYLIGEEGIARAE